MRDALTHACADFIATNVRPLQLPLSQTPAITPGVGTASTKTTLLLLAVDAARFSPSHGLSPMLVAGSLCLSTLLPYPAHPVGRVCGARAFASASDK